MIKASCFKYWIRLDEVQFDFQLDKISSNKNRIQVLIKDKVSEFEWNSTLST